MCDCCQPASIAFFDSIALKWDSWENIESLKVKFKQGIGRFGIQPGEHVLDVGCGTGNLTAAVLRALSPEGRVIAVDISGKMLEIARAKIVDSRVTWVCGAVEHMDTSRETFDRIICCSVWPHLEDPGLAARLFRQMLKPGGKLHIWHLISRGSVNKIHAKASEAVNDHILAPSSCTAALLERSGFVVEETQDDDSGYLVTGRKV